MARLISRPMVLAINILFACGLTTANLDEETVKSYAGYSAEYDKLDDSISRQITAIPKTLASFLVTRCKLDKNSVPFKQNTNGFENFLKKIESGNVCVSRALMATITVHGNRVERDAIKAELVRRRMGRVDVNSLTSFVNKMHENCKTFMVTFQQVLDEADLLADQIENAPDDSNPELTIARATAPICKSLYKRGTKNLVVGITKEIQRDGVKRKLVGAKNYIRHRLQTGGSPAIDHIELNWNNPRRSFQ